MGRARPIPTCVGQPLSCRQTLVDIRAYPHVCGATDITYEYYIYIKGLSPRVWGNPCQPVPAVWSDRPIPTCVGQPQRESMAYPVRWAYPHVCGATVSTMTAGLSLVGLSPRVWGNRLWTVAGRQSAGPIPTCVGQPFS